MSDKNRDYEDYFVMLEEKCRNTNTSQRGIQKPVNRQTGRYLSESRRKAIRRRKQRRVLTVTVVVLSVILLLLILLLCKGCFSGNEKLQEFSGVWQYTDDMKYEFDGNGSGCMCIGRSNHYEFTYEVEENTLRIDYVVDYITDCEYTYEIGRDKLKLIGGKGTAEIGKAYELTKVDNGQG